MSRFSVRRLAAMKPYIPGEQPQDRKYIKLNTNECPYPPSPRVLEVINNNELSSLKLYPDPEAKVLREALAEYYGVKPSQVMVGNGSDEILAFFFMAFCDEEKKVAFPDITYGFYKVFAKLFGVDALQIPLREDFSIDVKDYIGIDRNIVIANPNAPTGLYLPLEDIERILRSNPDHLVLIDEAYIDFGGRSSIELLPKYDNLLICGTFSKSRALAGARLGYSIGTPEAIEDLNKIKFSFNPYNVNRLTLLAGKAAIEDREYFEDCRAKVIATREDTARRLKSLGFELTDSKANFLFARHPKLSGEECYLKLKEGGILVRYFDEPRTRDYVRITMGTPEEMKELMTYNNIDRCIEVQ